MAHALAKLAVELKIDFALAGEFLRNLLAPGN
jgi:hypothetical protein